MTTKSSIALTERRFAFAKQRVDSAKFPSVSAMVQHGVEVLREKAAQEAEERQALNRWIESRLHGVRSRWRNSGFGWLETWRRAARNWAPSLAQGTMGKIAIEPGASRDRRLWHGLWHEVASGSGNR